MCDIDTHFTWDCYKYAIRTERISCLRELKVCSFCTKPGHKGKSCGYLHCPFLSKNGHISTLCNKKLLSLKCNKGKNHPDVLAFPKK